MVLFFCRPFVKYGTICFFESMICSQIGKLRFLFDFFDWLVRLTVRDIKPFTVAEIQLLADRSIAYRVFCKSQLNYPLPFVFIQRTLSGWGYDFDAVDFCQQIKVFKRKCCLCRTFFIRFQRTAANHLFNLVTGIRTIAAGSLVKRALWQIDFKIAIFQFLCRIRIAVLLLGAENFSNLFLVFRTGKSIGIIIRLVALKLRKLFILIQHLADGAIVSLNHQLFVAFDRRKEFSCFRTLFFCVNLSVGFESSSLRQMNKQPDKFFSI